MNSKKPTKYISCPRCKGSNFHYKNIEDRYVCNDCGMVVKG